MSMDSSWSDTRGGDIIDLDRYMCNTVKPTARARQQRTNCGPELVVDGGAALKTTATRVRQKRYSHDSGLSDTSYSRHRRISRPHRRQSNLNESRIRESTRQETPDSLRQFRAVCEQALLEQQRQIAHVTQLCEKLTQRAVQTEQTERTEQKDVSTEKHADEKTDDDYEAKLRQNSVVEKTTNEKSSSVKNSSQKCQSSLGKSDRLRAVRRRESSEMSDMTSSSRSTPDARRKDKHRSQQCRTYKLIMSKLDDLNHVFQSRAPAPRAAPRPGSSTSVSVCDKVVATDGIQTLRVGGSAGGRRVTQAFALDIAPGASHWQPKPNVATESVLNSALVGGSATSGGDPRCGFDLDDPLHLYSQAKRLQSPSARTTTRRGRSLDTRDTSDTRRDTLDTRQNTRRDTSESRRSVTLCYVCRGYWRSLRRCLAPLFDAPEHSLNKYF